MGVYCIVVGCKSNHSKDKVSFFKIPKPISEASPVYKHKIEELRVLNAKLLERQNSWIRAIRRGPLDGTKFSNARVCQKHFISGKPSGPLETNHPDWVPSQNLGYVAGVAVKRKSSLDLYERAEERAIKRARFDSCKNEVIIIKNSEVLNLNCETNNANDSLPQEPSHNPCQDQDSYSKKNQEVQTTITMDKLCEKFRNLDCAISENEKLQSTLNDLLFKQESFIGNNAKTKYFTGLSSYDMLSEIHMIIAPYLSNTHRTALTTFQQLTLTLVKLRLNYSFECLSYRFGLSTYTIGRYFRSTIHVLYCTFKNLIHWPDRDVLHRTIPSCFRENYEKKVTAVIDCFEIFIESPSGKDACAATWSSYKHHKTGKNLISITPQGSINYLSESWGGRTSDKFLTEHCGFLGKLKPGDYIMADRGFTISDTLKSVGVNLIIPSFTKGRDQLSPNEVETTRKIANVRIHVERVIGVLRQKFTFMSSTVPISMLMVDEEGFSTYDEILVVCCALFNLCPAIIPMG